MLHSLVVERDPEIAARIQRTFETRGPYRVTTTSTARQALDVLAADRPALAVIDETLPDLAGWEFARQASHLGVAVLMLVASDIVAMRMRRAGCPYVPRPFHVEFLLQETRRLLRDPDGNRQKTLRLLDQLMENPAELARSTATARSSITSSSPAPSARAERTPSMWRSFKLQVVPQPERGRIIQAPPVITVRADSNYYLCGGCDTLLMIADTQHLHGLTIHCRNCSSCNTTLS